MSTDAADVATRRAWDEVARDYARLVPDLSVETPLDRAVLAAFAEMVAEEDGALIADVGCGAGRVTRHLHDQGLSVVGFDLSPVMAGVAHATHPGLPFAAAHAKALPLADGVLGGVIAWYSLIHLPTASLAAVFAELARVTRPGAPLLVAFQSGDGRRVDRTTSYGRLVPLTYYRHRADDVTKALTTAGFTPYGSVERTAALSFESTSQTALLAHRDQR